MIVPSMADKRNDMFCFMLQQTCICSRILCCTQFLTLLLIAVPVSHHTVHC